MTRASARIRSAGAFAGAGARRGTVCSGASRSRDASSAAPRVHPRTGDGYPRGIGVDPVVLNLQHTAGGARRLRKKSTAKRRGAALHQHDSRSPGHPRQRLAGPRAAGPPAAGHPRQAGGPCTSPALKGRARGLRQAPAGPSRPLHLGQQVDVVVPRVADAHPEGDEHSARGAPPLGLHAVNRLQKLLNPAGEGAAEPGRATRIGVQRES